MPDKKIGIWFIGARGGVATSAIVGLSALARGAIDLTGLVSELRTKLPSGLTDLQWKCLVYPYVMESSLERLKAQLTTSHSPVR